jgi:hypothetical protein
MAEAAGPTLANAVATQDHGLVVDDAGGCGVEQVDVGDGDGAGGPVNESAGQVGGARLHDLILSGAQGRERGLPDLRENGKPVADRREEGGVVVEPDIGG